MNISRSWAMPNKNTFDIPPIHDFIYRWFDNNSTSIDPFSNTNRIAGVCNDIDPLCDADYCMDALSFLRRFDDKSVDIVLFDPPYSPRQISESYKKVGLSVNMETTQSSYWSNMKDEIKRIVSDNGIVLSFGWNSNGIGKTRGFVMEELLLVAHGGAHNDTICVAERKMPTLF